MVRNDAYTGALALNPFNFQHFNVSELSVTADGQNVQNIKPLKMDYGNHQYVEAYNSVFAGTSRLFHDVRLGFDRIDYPNDYALYAFDLSPDLTDDQKFDPLCTGSLRFQIKFNV